MNDLTQIDHARTSTPMSGPSRQMDGWAIAAGLVLLLTGFGAIITFWFVGSWPSNLPGFWTYRSPNLGDGLLLPTAAGLLVAAVRRMPPVRFERGVTTTAAALGVLGGAAEQYAWWSDPNPPINWTVPAPHVFNAPGIYHAIFLSLASGFFAGATALVLWRAHGLRVYQPEALLALLRSPGAAILVGCLLAFVGFILLDNHHVPGYAVRSNRTNAASVVAVVAALVIGGLLLSWSFGKALVRSWRTLQWATVLAVSLCLLSWDTAALAELWKLPDALAIMLCCMAISLYIWKLELPYWPVRLFSASCCLLGGLAICHTIARSDLNLALLGALLVLGVIGLVTGALTHKEARQILLGLAFPVLVLVYWMWAGQSPRGVQGGHLVAPLLSLLWPAAIYAGVLVYMNLVRDEHHFGSGYRAEQSFWVIYIALIFLLSAMAIVSLALADMPGSVLHVGTRAAAQHPPVLSYLLCGTVLAAALAVAAVCLSHPRRPVPALPKWPEEPALRVTLPAMLFAVIAALIWAITPWLATYLSGTSVGRAAPSAWRIPIYVIGVLYALWLGMVTIDSMHLNISRTEFYQYTIPAWIITGVAGLAVISAVLWLVTIGLWTAGTWTPYISMFECIVLIISGCLTVVPMCAWTLERAKIPVHASPQYLTLHSPPSGVFNDEIMHGFALSTTILVVYVVNQVIIAAQHSADPALVVVQVLLVIAPVLVILLPAFRYVIQQTANHVAFERERLSASMLARALGDEAVAEKLRDVRADRIEHRFDRVEGVAFPLSPYGLIALVAQAVRSLMD